MSPVLGGTSAGRRPPIWPRRLSRTQPPPLVPRIPLVNSFQARLLIRWVCYVLPLGSFILVPETPGRPAAGARRLSCPRPERREPDRPGCRSRGVRTKPVCCARFAESLTLSEGVSDRLQANAQFIPVGIDPLTVTELEDRLNIKTEPPIFWSHGPPLRSGVLCLPAPTTWWFVRPIRVPATGRLPGGFVARAAYVVHGHADECGKLKKLLRG